MPNIFNYCDYRKFLADYYEEKKAASSSFSYQSFSRQAGFTSKSFVFNVIKGKKNLSKASIVSISEAMGLTKTESEYFEKLVSFCQASTFKERDFFYGHLNSIRPQNAEASTAKKLRQDQFEFYSKLHHVVIRSLIDLFPVKDDYKRLAAMVQPPITPALAKKSVELLERLGLVEKQKDGVYVVQNKLLTTGPEVGGLAAQHFHLEAMALAARALKELPGNRRNIYGLTLGISQRACEEINKVMIGCQNRILEIAGKDIGSDRVYQLNVQFFPVSKTITEGGSK